MDGASSNTTATATARPKKKRRRKAAPRQQLVAAVEPARKLTLDEVAQHWAVRLLGTAFLGVLLYVGARELESIDASLQAIQKDQAAFNERITSLEKKFQTIDERAREWDQLRKHYKEAVEAYNGSEKN